MPCGSTQKPMQVFCENDHTSYAFFGHYLRIWDNVNTGTYACSNPRIYNICYLRCVNHFSGRHPTECGGYPRTYNRHIPTFHGRQLFLLVGPIKHCEHWILLCRVTPFARKKLEAIYRSVCRFRKGIWRKQGRFKFGQGNKQKSFQISFLVLFPSLSLKFEVVPAYAS